MDDTISRQAAIKLAIDLDCESRGIIKESKCREIENRYNMIPSAQPQRMRGRWIPYNLAGGGYWVCTACKHPTEAFAANVIYNFCPFCGADMRGGEQDGFN